MSDVGTLGGASLRERTAEEVRALLARRKMSATQLARELKVSQAYVWRRLSGETAFDLDDLERIANVLTVEVIDLLPPMGREGRTVVVGGETRRQTTVAKVKTPDRTSPIGWPNRSHPHWSTRRPVRLALVDA
jgi:transcriptional regulator with XRE-family HTH domain